MGILRFGDFTLDERRFELRNAGTPVALQPKVFDLLRHLVRHRDRVVTRDELFAEVWPGVRVGQASLNRVVRELRRALGDDDRDPRFVATVQRRGYRFVAPVEPERRASSREQRVHAALVQVAAASTHAGLMTAFHAASRIVDAADAVLCVYEHEGLDGARLSGHRGFVETYRPEYARDDVFHRRALEQPDDTPHIAMHMPPDLRRRHFRTLAYDAFYRPLGLNDFICAQLTGARPGTPGSAVLLFGRDVPYTDAELEPILWLRDVFAAALTRVRRSQLEPPSDLHAPSGALRYSAWSPGGELLWHSPTGAALVGSAHRAPAALRAALSAWGDVARGEISAEPPPPCVRFVDERSGPVAARLHLGQLGSGQPLVLVDFEAPRSSRDH